MLQAIHTRKHGEMGTLMLVMAPLMYMVMCCHYSLFRLGFIKVFTFHHHVVPHCTHSTSLLRNGAWACRFIAPICYNYLHVIRMQNYLASGQVWHPEQHATSLFIFTTAFTTRVLKTSARSILCACSVDACHVHAG